jgi:hypothetical protein
LERSLLAHLGAARGASLFAQFAELCELVRRSARRQLMHRYAGCCAAGAGEGAFATMVAAAAAGEREDAMLIAVCLVRADVSPTVVALAWQVGLGRMPRVPRVTRQDARRLR